MKKGAILFLLLACASCGRLADPLPPEALAPKQVDSLAVTANAGGVSFEWSTPGSDRRGKELKFLDGYSVERKEIVERGDETNPDVEFFQLAFIPDKSVEFREELRKAAREEGKLGRRLKAPDAMRHFTFLDPTPQVGRTYIYQIVPQNQGGVEGAVKRVVKVLFNGEKTDVSLLDATDLDDKQDDRKKNQGRGGKP